MSKQKSKHMRSDKNLDKLLSESFSCGEEKTSEVSKLAAGGCGLKLDLSICSIINLALVVLAVLLYYNVMDNARYGELTTVEDWGPPDTIMAIAGIVSVGINYWLSSTIKTSCPDNCCVMIVMTFVTLLLGLVFPYILLYSDPATDWKKYCFWIMTLALILLIWVYFSTCSCLNKCARTFLFVNIVWTTYIAVWIGTILTWNVF